jgi:DNA-binding MarR family transcriptional regulator
MQTLDPEQQLGYLMVRVADRISKTWHAALRRHAINPRQFSTLALLVRDPTLSQAELARRVLVTPQSMSDSLANLIDAGLLERGAFQAGRAAQLEVSAQGKALLRKAYPIVAEADRVSFAPLSDKEQTLLSQLLTKQLNALNPESGTD